MQPEPKSKSTRLVYGALAAIWLLVIGWLALEHAKVADLARQALLNRARDISGTIALVSRSGPPGFVRQSRLESVLGELVKTTELDSVALLNAQGEVVATAGEALDLDLADLPGQGARWTRHGVTVVNLVDFGQSTRGDGTVRPPTVVIPQSEEEEERRRLIRMWSDRATTGARNAFGFPPAPLPMPAPLLTERVPLPPFDHPDDIGGSLEMGPPRREDVERGAWGRFDRAGRGESADRAERGDVDRAARGEGERDRSTRSRVFRRPFWMDPDHYEDLIAKRGLHGFVFVMSTDAMDAELSRDLWLRVGVAIAAFLAVAGLGIGWRGLVRSTQLRIRLVRAQEMNEHLREMNLAAAGLAHEARNPLNIVRGVAQMIDRNAGLPEPVREQAGQITEEVDRITQRLNEFIKYSRPAQPRLGPTPLASVVADVFAALQSDLEDKGVRADNGVPPRNILADESLLRQVVFNLLLNAIQAVGEGGRVAVAFTLRPHGEGVLSVEDDGPGVPPDQREQIFRPYYTTHEKGSGLGLAVVRQIVLAHHWEIECSTSGMGGAAFHIRGIRILEPEDKASS